MARNKSEHIEFIKNNVGKISVREMCGILDLKEYQVRYITDKKLGLDLRKVGKCRPNWNDEEIAILSDPNKTDYEKAKLIPSRTDSAVRMQRRRLRFDSKPVEYNESPIHQGYQFIRKKSGYSGNKDRYIREHRLIIEKHIGRTLKKGEIVHHINGRKLDNRIENLCVCNGQTEHINIHNQLMEVIAELMDRGVVHFDFTDKQYKVKKSY